MQLFFVRRVFFEIVTAASKDCTFEGKSCSFCSLEGANNNIKNYLKLLKVGWWNVAYAKHNVVVVVA